MYYKIWKFSDWKFHALIVYSFSIDIDKQIGCSSRKILIFTSHKFYPLSYENARTHVALTVKKKKRKIVRARKTHFRNNEEAKDWIDEWIGSKNRQFFRSGIQFFSPKVGEDCSCGGQILLIILQLWQMLREWKRKEKKARKIYLWIPRRIAIQISFVKCPVNKGKGRVPLPREGVTGHISETRSQTSAINSGWPRSACGRASHAMRILSSGRGGNIYDTRKINDTPYVPENCTM